MGCHGLQTGTFTNCSFWSGWQELTQKPSHPRNTQGDILRSLREPGFQGLLNGFFLPLVGVPFKAARRTEH